MILVVGATGLLGNEICRQAIEKGHQVRALIRKTSDPSKVEQLQSMGCQTVEGDLKDPASLSAACQGIKNVISTASSTFSRQEGDAIATVDHRGQLNLVEAAENAGVQQFIFISFPDDEDYPNALNDAKRSVEQCLQQSNMSYVSLQANYFMEVWLSPALGFDYANKTARIYGDGTGKHNWVSYKDVAKTAVACVDHPAAANKVLSVGGPESLSPLEVVRIFEELTGSKFAVDNVPKEGLQAQWEGAPTPLDKAFASLMLSYAKGWPMDTTEVQQALGVTFTQVQTYAEQVTSGN